MTRTSLLLLAFCLLFAGCRNDSTLSVAGVTDTHATAIALSEQGEIVDFYHITPGSELQKITFVAPENGEPIRVTVVGPSISYEGLRDTTVSSRRQEGFLGGVEVEIQQDQIVSVAGNGVSTSSPLTHHHLELVKKEIDSGRLTLGNSVETVKRNPFLKDLVQDSNGNEIPANLSPTDQAFLTSFIKHLETGNRAALSKVIHKDASDTSLFDTALHFLLHSSGRNITHYRFMRFNAEHPENEFHTEGARYSLPVEWILTIQFEPEPDNYFTHSDILLGVLNDQLFVPTKYAE